MKLFGQLKLTVLISIVLLSCESEDPSTIDENFYLKNDGAEMPVFVRGNAESNKIVVIVHGGPGGKLNAPLFSNTGIHKHYGRTLSTCLLGATWQWYQQWQIERK